MLDIVIPNYNYLQDLINTLNSFGPFINTELVHIYIVDDGSTQITQDDYKTIEKQFAYLHPTILFLSENHGAGYARAAGIKAGHGKYVFCIDSGNILATPYIISELFEEFKKHPEIELFSFPYIATTEEGQRFGICSRITEFHSKIFKREIIEKYHIIFPCIYPNNLEDTPLWHVVNSICTYNKTHLHNKNLKPIIRIGTSHSLTANKKDYCINGFLGYFYNGLQVLLTIKYPPKYNIHQLFSEFLCSSYVLLLQAAQVDKALKESYLDDFQYFYIKLFNKKLLTTDTFKIAYNNAVQTYAQICNSFNVFTNFDLLQQIQNFNSRSIVSLERWNKNIKQIKTNIQ